MRARTDDVCPSLSVQFVGTSEKRKTNEKEKKKKKKNCRRGGFFFFDAAAASLSAARGDRRAAPFSSTAEVGAFAPSESPETLSGSFSSFQDAAVTVIAPRSKLHAIRAVAPV